MTPPSLPDPVNGDLLAEELSYDDLLAEELSHDELLLVRSPDAGPLSPPPPVCGNISPAFDPTPADLAEARLIDLTREAGSPEAGLLAEAVAAGIVPHLGRKRPLGPVGMATLRADVGTILAGLLRARFKDRVVAAQRRPGGSLWKNSPIGHRAFWSKIEALHKAGLVGLRFGIKTWSPFSGPGFDGQATRLWTTSRLVALSTHHNVAATSIARDWPISRAAETMRPLVERSDLVICRGLSDDDKPAPLSPGEQAMMERMRSGVEALNAAAERADIRGCLAPAFRRIFRHDLRLGGRLYAVGANNIQNMNEAERRAITIDGEPVVELDIHASQLTVFLALTGTRELPEGDLYAVGGFHRDVVKAWVVQTFATGSLVARWSNRTAHAIRAVKATAVRAAVISAYPAFGRPLRSIVPPALLQQLPEEQRGWAVGSISPSEKARLYAAPLDTCWSIARCRCCRSTTRSSFRGAPRRLAGGD